MVTDPVLEALRAIAHPAETMRAAGHSITYRVTDDLTVALAENVAFLAALAQAALDQQSLEMGRTEENR